jgi:hypothetical protein
MPRGLARMTCRQWPLCGCGNLAIVPKQPQADHGEVLFLWFYRSCLSFLLIILKPCLVACQIHTLMHSTMHGGAGMAKLSFCLLCLLFSLVVCQTFILVPFAMQGGALGWQNQQNLQLAAGAHLSGLLFINSDDARFYFNSAEALKKDVWCVQRPCNTLKHMGATTWVCNMGATTWVCNNLVIH